MQFDHHLLANVHIFMKTTHFEGNDYCKVSEIKLLP